MDRIRRYPVSIFLAYQYGLWALVPAVATGSENAGFVAKVVLIALLTAFTVEFMCPSPRGVVDVGRSALTNRAVWVVSGIGLVAHYLAFLGGANSYGAQTGASSVASWVSLVSPLTVFLLFGVILGLGSYQSGSISRAAYTTLVLVSTVSVAVIGLLSGIVKSGISFAISVVFMLILAGFLRIRVAVSIALVLVLAWPLVQPVRDAIRSQQAGTLVESTGTPTDRLRLDEQLALADRLRTSVIRFDPPSPLTVVRTGLLPSVIDRDRPPISTGTQMSQALGGSRKNAVSATVLGNVLIILGWGGLIAYVFVVAVAMRLLLWRPSTWSVSAVAMVVLYLLSFSASFPDGLVRLLQGGEALFVLYAVIKLSRRKEGRVRRGARRGASHSGRARTRTAS